MSIHILFLWQRIVNVTFALGLLVELLPHILDLINVLTDLVLGVMISIDELIARLGHIINARLVCLELGFKVLVLLKFTLEICGILLKINVIVEI